MKQSAQNSNAENAINKQNTDDLKQELAQSQTSLEEKGCEIVDLRSQIEALKLQIEDQKRISAGHLTINQVNEKSIAARDSEIFELANRIETLQSQLESQNKIIVEKEQIIENLNAQNSGSMQHTDDLEEQLAQRQTSLEEQGALILEFRSQIEALILQLEDQKRTSEVLLANKKKNEQTVT